MRQIKQMLRLAHDGVSSREIGRTLGIARSTVQDNLVRVSVAGLTWPLGPEVTDAVLEQRLFPPEPVEALKAVGAAPPPAPERMPALDVTDARGRPASPRS